VVKDDANAPDDESGGRMMLKESPREGLGLAAGLIAGGAVVAAVISCLVATRRGIDLTDESYYLLSSLHPKLYLQSSTEFQLFVGPVLSFVKYVWVLRVVALLSLVAAGVMFSMSFLWTAPSLMGARFPQSERLAIVAALTAGSLMPSVYLPQTPGYNQLTLGVLLYVSSLLLLLADGQIPRTLTPFAWAVVGVLIWVQFLVKWPAVVAILPLAALALWRGRSLVASSIRCALYVMSGVLLAAIVTNFLVEPLPRLLTGIRLGSQDLATYAGHNATALVGQYVIQMHQLTMTIADSYGYLLLAGVLVGVLAIREGFRRFAAIGMGAGLGLLSPVLILDGSARGGVAPWANVYSWGSLLPMYVVVSMIVGTTALVVRRRMSFDRRLLFLLALLIMPFLSAIGTNNYIWFNAMFAATFWIAAVIALNSVSFGNPSRHVVRGLALAFAILIAFTAVNGTWDNPYRQSPLISDTVPLSSPSVLSGVRVDPATATFFAQIQSAVKATHGAQSPYLVAWAGMPGAALAGRLVQPVFAWITGNAAQTLVLKASCQDQRRGILILKLPGNPEPPAGGLPPECSNRRWVKFRVIDIPSSAGLGTTQLEMYFAHPIT